MTLINSLSLIDFEIILRYSLVIILGGAIGWQREEDFRSAGFRTHILVCLGSMCATVLNLRIHELYPGDSPMRMVANILTAVGFIGGGAVIKHKKAVFGITTAASVWNVSILGITIGFGYYDMAWLTTMTTLVILGPFKKLNPIASGITEDSEEE